MSPRWNRVKDQNGAKLISTCMLRSLLSVHVCEGHSFVSGLAALWLNAVSLARTDSGPLPRQQLKDETSGLLSLRQEGAGP